MSRPLAIVLLGSVCFVGAAALAIGKVDGWGWLMFAGFLLATQL